MEQADGKIQRESAKDEGFKVSCLSFYLINI